MKKTLIKNRPNNEDTKVVIRPAIRGKKLNEENSFRKNELNQCGERNFWHSKRKENFAASALSQPDSRAVEIVIPDLETPGKIAA